ncbi:MAG: asparagine synthase (glutamine-hydrolyzing) [Lachnospiraceae bacterium]|nr:asparagine synthase (glutamine-hydrolyzing) [Lachnospiraceae bacterium]
MCGICGIYGNADIRQMDLRIQKMLDSMSHRGPDAKGYKVLKEGSIFGQRRLSIIDLAVRANQPMESRQGNVITYNGEIYNYLELKKEIAYSYKTTSDTEVLLAGMESKGIDWTLSQSNGMFAFAYFDKKTDAIYLARDRMGIKPLFYYIDHEKVIFASEIKAILNSGLVEAVLNEDAIDEYLGNRYVRAPYTFFVGIYQVLPGHYLKINSNCEVEDIQYWELPSEFNMEREYDEAEIAEVFCDHVRKAIKRRMVSDVPVGTYLSGGIDSSLITAIASEYRTQLHTYIIGFRECNEFKYAKMVAQRYETCHHEITMEMEDYFGMLEEVIQFKDAPLGVPNEVPLAKMSKELKKNITVVLSGEGADELLGGYGRIFRSPFDYKNLGIDREKCFYDYLIDLYEYMPRKIRDAFLTTDHPLRERYDGPLKKEFSFHGNEENVFRFFHKYHVKGLLQRVDTTTMLASVEARVPFLDHTLIEFAYKGIPYDLKLKWKDGNCLEELNGLDASFYSERKDTPKYLLRKVSYKYLPKEVIERRKVGFPVPLDMWIDALMRNVKELLKEAYWIKRDKLDELILSCREQPRAGQLLWMFVNIELFRKKYFLKSWKY